MIYFIQSTLCQAEPILLSFGLNLFCGPFELKSIDSTGDEIAVILEVIGFSS